MSRNRVYHLYKSIPFTERQQSRRKQLNLFFGKQLFDRLCSSFAIFASIFESIAFASSVFVTVVFLPSSRKNFGRSLLCYGLAKYFSPPDVDYLDRCPKSEYIKVVHEQWSVVEGLFSLDDLPSSSHSKCRLQVYFLSSVLVQTVLPKTLLFEAPYSTVQFKFALPPSYIYFQKFN